MRNRRSRGAVRLVDALINIELRPNRPIADRVNDDLQTRLVGADRPLFEILRRVDEQSAIARLVGERFQKRGGVGAERAVDKSFQSADAQPIVASASLFHFRGKPLPLR